MAAFTSKAADLDWNAEGQTSWNEVGHPVAGDTVTLGHNMKATASVACATVVSSVPGTNRTLTFDDTAHVITGPCTCVFSGAATDLSIIVDGHIVDATDAFTATATPANNYRSGNLSEAAATILYNRYPKGTFFTAAGFASGGSNGLRVVGTRTLTLNGAASYVDLAVASTAEGDEAGTLARWTPITIEPQGNPGLSTGASNGVTVSLTGCCRVLGIAGRTVATVTSGYAIILGPTSGGFVTSISGNVVATTTGHGIWDTDGVILEIVGDQTSASGQALHIDGYVGTVTGNQVTATGIALVVNSGPAGTVTGNQTATGAGGTAIKFVGGTMTELIGNQTSTTGIALWIASGILTKATGNQTATGDGGYALRIASPSGLITELIGNQTGNGTDGAAIYSEGEITTLTGNQSASGTGGFIIYGTVTNYALAAVNPAFPVGAITIGTSALTAAILAAWQNRVGSWRFKTAALAQVAATGVALDATVSKPGTAQTITPPATMALAGEAAAALTAYNTTGVAKEASVGAIPASVLDHALAAHATAGTVGAKLNAQPYSITPLAVTVSAGAVTESKLTAYQYTTLGPYTMTITDDSTSHAAVDLSGHTVRMDISEIGKTGTPDSTLSSTASQITIGGTGNNVLTITGSHTYTAKAGLFEYRVRNHTDDVMLTKGTLKIVPGVAST
jgi:hypothetical protein